jgi:hypothetical protein
MVGTANSLNLGQQPRDASRSSTTKKKSVSARGRLAETRGGFAGHAARANAPLKRRHAASGNKTNFQLSIFPILGLFSQKRSATAAGTCVTCTQRSSTAHAIVPMRANENRTPRNKISPQQVFSLATRSSFGSIRERKHAPE